VEACFQVFLVLRVPQLGQLCKSLTFLVLLTKAYRYTKVYRKGGKLLCVEASKRAI
jgi:hypothetical protein